MHVNQEQLIKPSAAFSAGPQKCLTEKKLIPIKYKDNECNFLQCSIFLVSS